MVKSRRGRNNVYWGAFVLDWFKYLQDNDLTSSDFKVLFYLCEKMNLHENKAYLRQKMIAEELKMDKGNVSKCIKRLCEKQFITKMDNGFMINPHLFYVGKRHPMDRLDLRETFDQLLEDNEISPIFDLNEDDSCLEYKKYGVEQEGFGF